MTIHTAVVAAFCACVSAFAQPTSVDVEFTGVGDMTLKGTLLLPETPGDAAGDEKRAKFPAILLLPGSGPTNRDGNQPPMLVTNLLKEVAERLAAEGVATLRFDKRATHVYAKEWPKDVEAIDAFFAFDRFVGDAAAALEYLQLREEIDAARTVIAGHSEGGLIALHVAHDLAGTHSAPMGLILMGTAGRTLDIVLREQVRANVERTNPNWDGKEALFTKLDEAIAASKAREPVPDDLPAGLRPLFNPTVRSLMYAYFTIDPAVLAAKVRGPVLIVQGEDDAQISAERDAPVLEAVLAEREGATTKLVVIAKASHNFKDTTDNPFGFTGPVMPEVLETMVGWAREHMGAGSTGR